MRPNVTGMRAAERAAWPLVALAVILVAVSVLGSSGGSAADRAVVVMLIDVVLVVGIYVFVGLSGVLSFGHVGFMAIGAYAGGLLTIPVEMKDVLQPHLLGVLTTVHAPFVLATVLAGLVAAVPAAALALPLARLSGLAAALATLAVLMVVNVVAKNWEQVTNGVQGMTAIPTTTTMPAALVFALVVILVAYLFQESRWGLRLRASREDEVAAQSVGIAVGRERGIAFVLSAFFVGMAGALFAQFQGSITPDAFYLPLTFSVIAMLVMGGMTSLSGAVLGTITISVLSEILRRAEQGFSVGPVSIPGRPGLSEVGLACLIVATLILRPAGITGGREIRWPFSGSKRTRPLHPVEPAQDMTRSA